MSTDRIEKKALLKASRRRVWDAITDAEKFGTWFGVAFDGPFREGESLTARIVPTQVDDEVAELQKPYEGIVFEVHVDRIESMDRFSFRWHPGPADPDADYSEEPMTLVVFELEDDPEGTLLTITESGFDQIPLERRAEAFESNESGWTKQLELIGKYLALQTHE